MFSEWGQRRISFYHVYVYKDLRSIMVSVMQRSMILMIYPIRNVKGCGMGRLLVLLSPCFRESVVAKWKIESFFCSLDNLLQKNVVVFFFGNQISKWRPFEKKRAIFDLLFTFFTYQGKVTKIPSAHISLIYIHLFCIIILLTFFALPILKKKNINLSGMVSF